MLTGRAVCLRRGRGLAQGQRRALVPRVLWPARNPAHRCKARVRHARTHACRVPCVRMHAWQRAATNCRCPKGGLRDCTGGDTGTRNRHRKELEHTCRMSRLVSACSSATSCCDSRPCVMWNPFALYASIASCPRRHASLPSLVTAMMACHQPIR